MGSVTDAHARTHARLALMESSAYFPLDEFHSLEDGPPPDTEMLNDANASE